MKDLKAINTIEFEPYRFAKSDLLPDLSTNEANYLYWKQSLAESNIDIEPITKNSWLVDVENISDSVLSVLLEKYTENFDSDDELEDYLQRIPGGVVIFEEDNPIITPNCCSDLGNLNNWESIFISENNNWEMLWIGHPYVYYRRQNGMIEFSEKTEGNVDKSIITKHIISEKWLETAIKQIRHNQDLLSSRIENILGKN